MLFNTKRDSGWIRLIPLVLIMLLASCDDAAGPTVDAGLTVLQPSESFHPLRWKAPSAMQFTAVAGKQDGDVLLAAQAGLAEAYAVSMYLGDGAPVGALETNAPTSSTLPNYDPDRDDFPGLLLAKSSDLVGETDPTKYQQWIAASGPFDVDGPVTLSLFSAMKGFATDKGGFLDAGLFECDYDGSNCSLLAQASTEVSGSSTWVQRIIDFGAVTHSVAAGRTIALKVVVSDQSDDDMWLAYGTTTYPSKLMLTGASQLQTFAVSFWAVRGEHRYVQINQIDAAVGIEYPFMRLDVHEPIQHPDGGTIAVGDSILISVFVDPEDITVHLEPSGLQFGSANPTVLDMSYSHANPDFNGDGVVNSTDQYIEQALLGTWYQHDVSAPWQGISSTQSLWKKEFQTILDHFSNYAIAW